MATATWTTFPSSSMLPSCPRSQSFGETLRRSPGQPGRTHQDIPWSLGAGGHSAAFGKPARRQGGQQGASLQWWCAQNPQCLPCWVVREGRGSQRVARHWVLKLDFFIHSRAGIRVDRPAARCLQLSYSWHIFHFSKSKFSCRVICNIFN